MTENNLVVGIASYIVDTCASSFPDFYTRLSTYDQWLKDMICGQALNKPEYCATSAPAGGESEPADPITDCLTIFLGVFNGFVNNLRKAVGP